MKRRNFIHRSTQAGMALSILGLAACKETPKKNAPAEGAAAEPTVESTPFFQLSLAQWSIHLMIREGGLDPYQFASKAKEWGFTGLEYVSQLYKEPQEATSFSDEAMQEFVRRCNEEARKYELSNVLIMVDQQGDLAVDGEADRIAAVERHKKWVDAAAAMGCHSIRVNLNGSEDPEKWTANSVDALTRLATYAQEKGINVLVENHGGLSSNAGMLAKVMQEVGMDNCGTLPDFGNFCISNGDTGCVEQYDRYKGVRELMPFAKAVSAKSNNFDSQGYERDIDYVKMLQIVRDAGYSGFIGVEYEGSELDEAAGIKATRDLLLKASKQLS
jgi:sugar phosphate isomerase/epimerase